MHMHPPSLMYGPNILSLGDIVIANLNLMMSVDHENEVKVR